MRTLIENLHLEEGLKLVALVAIIVAAVIVFTGFVEGNGQYSMSSQLAISDIISESGQKF